MARIYLNLVYTVFEPLTRVCNISMHTSIHESLVPLSVKLSEPAVFRSRDILTASRFKLVGRANPLTSPWLLCSSLRDAVIFFLFPWGLQVLQFYLLFFFS